MYRAIGLISAAGLAFQITLTRLFAVSQGYHFGFLAISIALLGFGASGTALTLRPQLARGAVHARLARLALVFAASIPASYFAINTLPFDAYRVAWERAQLLYLVLYYLALVVPFFISGLALGLPFAAFPTQSARIYAANLVGAGCGGIAALGALNVVGAEGGVLFAALLAALGAQTLVKRAAAVRVVLPLMALLLALLLLYAPHLFTLQLSPYKSLSQTLRFPDARVVWRAEDASTRVQVVESSAIRSAPGLSLNYRGAMPATQRGLFVDAESVTPLTDAAPRELLDALPVTLAYRLRPNARALIVKPGGGIEVLAALQAGVAALTLVEENALMTQAAHEYLPSVHADARVRVVNESARGWLARTGAHYDVVHLALGAAFRPVTAGAFALGENYWLTREAFAQYLNHLNADGILVVHRWLQLPPTEEVRVAAIAIEAMEKVQRPVSDVQSRQVLALRSFNTFLLLVKPAAFEFSEIEMAERFAQARQFDWVYRPGLRAEEANRFNVLREDTYYDAFQRLLDAGGRDRFIAAYAYDIAPTTDDRPFFFHFFRWEQTPLVLELMGKTFQPFGGSGYLVLVVWLAVSVLASVMLVLLPVVLKHRELGALEERRELKELSGKPFARFASGRVFAPLVYFALLGLAFLFVEIPLIGRFILFFDQPVYAFAVVVFTLLCASGVGSYVAPRLPHRAMLTVLIFLSAVYGARLTVFFEYLLGVPVLLRVFLSVLVLTPLGFLMGIPFPKGLARLSARAPHLIPLAWAVNGCASVLASILATMGALAFDFSAVMFAGAICYALALGLRE